MSERKRRIAENEAVFRSVNEEIRNLSSTLTTATDLRVVCECGTRSCTEQFLIAPADYARVREDPTHFVIKPGHDFPETETAIEKHDEYWIIAKDPGLPAEIAADPYRE
jgi:hypothetical protein